MSNILVSVCIITFNQESLIAKAIDGVLMQKADFDIRLIIVDDASTDTTRDICREYAVRYPEKISFFRNETNIGAVTNFYKTLQRGTGKYIALCEGDDYWTDPLKLQKQVDFMEANPECGMVHGPCVVYDVKSRISTPSFYMNADINLLQGDIFETLLLNNRIYTCTVCIRKDILDRYKVLEATSMHNFKMGDFPLWIEVARHSKVGYIPDLVATYVRSNNTSSSFNNLAKRYEFINSAFEMRFFYANKYVVPKEIIKKITTLKLKHELHFAFILRRKPEATESYNHLLQINSGDLDFESRLDYFGTRNYINYMAVKLLRKILYTIKVLRRSTYKKFA